MMNHVAAILKKKSSKNHIEIDSINIRQVIDSVNEIDIFERF